jgi:hypothetical protein
MDANPTSRYHFKHTLDAVLSYGSANASDRPRLSSNFYVSLPARVRRVIAGPMGNPNVRQCGAPVGKRDIIYDALITKSEIPSRKTSTRRSQTL